MFDMMLSPENYYAIRDDRERAIASGRRRRELRALDASAQRAAASTKDGTERTRDIAAEHVEAAPIADGGRPAPAI